MSLALSGRGPAEKTGQGAAAPPLKRFDIVRLKSGGPAMTIIGLSDLGEPMATCQWFAASERLTGSFFVGALDSAKAADD